MRCNKRSFLGVLAFILSMCMIINFSAVHAYGDDSADITESEPHITETDTAIDEAEEEFAESLEADDEQVIDDNEFVIEETEETANENSENSAEIELDKENLAELVPEAAEIQAVNATAPTKWWVEPSEENNIPLQIDVFKNQSTYQLFLPGNAVLDKCYLSWDGGATVTINSKSYESGTCPITSLNTTTKYTFKNGNTTLSEISIITYQGSASVEPIFINIIETPGHTIEEMDGDADHEVTCSGEIYIEGTKYDLSKIKGRGNYTWKMSQDKRAYNLTLGSKINFPGIESGETKKWTILSEIADHSLLCNRAGFYLANKLNVGQDTASADVWMNGEYQGCYTVTPKTDSFVTKDGYLIEEDNYKESLSVAEGGDPQFALDGLNGSGNSGSNYNLITVKKIGDNLLLKDGVVDESAENVLAVAGSIQSWLQDAWDAIRSTTGYNSKNKYYTDYIDIKSFAKMYLMQEYVKSYDVCAGSILFHRDGQTDDDKLIAGPIWDLDNAMGSVQSNNSLGSVGDRRSGKGAFISQIREYKTSIYKALGRHDDFMDEVTRQYNKYKSEFDSLENNVNTMMTEISASANMNHAKVKNISNYNLHYYNSGTTLESGTVYAQTMVKASSSDSEVKTNWSSYAANLKTYIHARSLWFSNTYYDSSYHCEHENLVNPRWEWNSNYTEATLKFDCADCDEEITYAGTVSKVYNNDDTITFTAVYVLNGETYTDTKTVDEFVVNFIKDEGVKQIDIYHTQDYSAPDETNVSKTVARSSGSGEPDISGDGQVNFEVVLKEGYTLTNVDAEGAFKNLKKPADTGKENTYRITKITGEVTVNITTVKCNHSTVSNPVWEWSDNCSSATLKLDCTGCNQVTLNGTITSVLGSDGQTITFTATAELNGTTYTDTKTAQAYAVTFVKDEHASVNIYHNKTSLSNNAADETNVSTAVARNGDSGNPVIDGEGQVTFEIVPEEGYTISAVNAEGAYKNLKNPTDLGKENTYRVTKVTGEVTVSITTLKCDHNTVSDPVWTWSDNCSSATMAVNCADCNQTITKIGTITSVLGSDGQTITFTATAELNGTPYTDTKTAQAYAVAFVKDEHATVNIYHNKTSLSNNEADETNVSTAVARNGDSGEPFIDGEGQVTFEIVPEEGYTISAVNAEGAYKNLKKPADLGKENTYRVTKITGEVTVNITTVKCDHNTVSDPVWTWSDNCSSATMTVNCVDCNQTITKIGTITSALGSDGQTITFTATTELNGTVYTDTKTAQAFAVTFDTDEHVSIKVYYKKNLESVNEAGVNTAVARNGDTGYPVIDGDGQVNFEIVPEKGYEILNVTAAPAASFNKLKGKDDTGKDNTYRVTKISGDLTVSVTTQKHDIYIDKYSLSLESPIGVRSIIYIPEEDVPNTNALIWFDEEWSDPIPVSSMKYTDIGDNKKARVFPTDVAMPQLRDTIKIKLQDNAEEPNPVPLTYNGVTTTEGFEYTAYTHIKEVLDTSDSLTLLKLAKTLDDLGKYSQYLFNYNVDNIEGAPDPVEEIPEGALKKYALSKTGTAEGIEYSDIKLEFASDTTLRIYFELTGDNTYKDYTFTVDGEEVKPQKSGSRYVIKKNQIASALLDEEHVFKVSKKGSEDGIEITCSALSYVHKMLSDENNQPEEALRNVLIALYWYNDAANAAFEQ